MPEPAQVWVFHAGALGDFVLTWPLLRALVRGGAEVTVVADGAKARLAASWLGVRPVDAEQRRFTRLWTGQAADDPVRGVQRVVTFTADEASDAGRRWLAAAATMFPGAAITPAGPPGSESRRRLWTEMDVERLGAAPARSNPSGPAVLHVGAGSRDKWWPMERWATLAAGLRGRGCAVRLIAGEVELDRMNRQERAALEHSGGEFLATLDDLAAALAGARLVVGADTGPTHLAAQLGVPTLALFGPTDPAIWGPRGPAVRILAPPRPSPMTWLDADAVIAAADAMLRGPDEADRL